MCPACIATAVVAIGGATSTGGFAAVFLKKLCGRISFRATNTSTERKSR